MGTQKTQLELESLPLNGVLSFTGMAHLAGNKTHRRRGKMVVVVVVVVIVIGVVVVVCCC